MRVEPNAHVATGVQPKPAPGLDRAELRRAELLRLLAAEHARLEEAAAEPEKGRWIDIVC